MKPLSIFILTNLLWYNLPAQSPDSLQSSPVSPLETLIEEYAGQEDNEVDFSEWSEALNRLEDHPVNINSSDPAELARLPLLNEQQIQNLETYKSTFGAITSIYELQLIEGFNQEFILSIAPYLSLVMATEEPFSWKQALRHASIKASLRYTRSLEKQAGYQKISDSLREVTPNGYYLGSPGGICMKLGSSYRDRFRYGFVIEKDPGEKLVSVKDSVPGIVDYFSGYVFFRNLGLARQWVVGDYNLHFGQGLTFSNGISFNNTNTALPSRKRGDPVRPSASTNENSFLRGTAINIQVRKFSLCTFYSGCRRDGNTDITDSVSGEIEVLRSFTETGYHRTVSELENRKAVKEKLAGGHIGYNGPYFRSGITGYINWFNKEISPVLPEYKKWQRLSTQMAFLGYDWSYSYRRLVLYGESSLQLYSGSAHLAGLNFSPGPAIAFASLFRWYAPSYTNRYANAFGESSENSNERGLYVGFSASPLSKLSLVCSADLVTYPWLHYRVDAPSQAGRITFYSTYSVGRTGMMSLQYRYATKPIAYTAESELLASTGTVKTSLWQFRFRYPLNAWLILQCRVDYLKLQSPVSVAEEGFHFSQDFQIAPPAKKWSLHFRYAVFDTDSYNSRIYTYENDLPSSFSVPALSGRGSRIFLMIKAGITEGFSAWFRYSAFIYPGKSDISEGISAVEGNRKSDVKLMLTWKIRY